MRRPKCYDGGQHRWRQQHTGSTDPYDRRCGKCGKWYGALLQEARRSEGKERDGGT